MYFSENTVGDPFEQKILTFWTHFERALSASLVWQAMPGHTHILDTFWEITVSQSSLAGNARTHSLPGHILRGHCQPVQFGRKCQVTLTYWTHFEISTVSQSVWQAMPGHTHSLDTFWKSTVSQSSLAGNARSHSHTGHILRLALLVNQFDRQCQDTLTPWTHFERALSGSLAGNAMSHSQPGDILREKCQAVLFGRKSHITLTSWTHFESALSANPLWQEISHHAYRLDTFWESSVSWSSLTENARSHSLPGHILREHC